MNRNVILVAAVAAAVLVSSGCQKLKARDQLNKGVQAFKNAQYPQAVENFKIAVDLDPAFPTARLYLATAYMSQYIPGADSPENMQMAKAAMDQFNLVLKDDPKNQTAVASIASLYFNQKKLDDAKDWYGRLTVLNPRNKEALYTLGVIAWTKTFAPRMEARAAMRMKPEDPCPLKDKKVRVALAAKSMPIVADGIAKLEEALKIDPEYDDAMAYVNLLYRERADLQDSTDACKADTETADNWVQKLLAIKKIKAERKPVSGGITTESK